MWPKIKLDNLRLMLPQLILEICLRIVLLVLICSLQFFVKPYVRHTTEEDLTKYHSNPRRDSLTPAWLAVCIVILLPLVAFTLPVVFSGSRTEFCQAVLAWTLALSINAFITESLKLTTGRLRPDFFHRCFPDGKVTKGLQCTGDLDDVCEGRKSFPSGHSSFSFCSMGFVSVWMCGRLRALSGCRGVLANAVACALPLMIAASVAVSRVYDHHHHWEDVAVGSLLGFFISYGCYAHYYYPLYSNMSGTPVPEIDILSSSPMESVCCSTAQDK